MILSGNKKITPAQYYIKYFSPLADFFLALPIRIKNEWDIELQKTAKKINALSYVILTSAFFFICYVTYKILEHL